MSPRKRWGSCQGIYNRIKKFLCFFSIRICSLEHKEEKIWHIYRKNNFRHSVRFRMSDSEGESYEKQVKIVLVGDGSSGKVKTIN